MLLVIDCLLKLQNLFEYGFDDCSLFCFVNVFVWLYDHPMLLLLLDLIMFFVHKFKNNLALELNFTLSLLLACKNKYTNKNITC